MTFGLDRVLAGQDQIITRRQALGYLTPDQIGARLGRRWQVILPGVYAAFTGGLSHRQRLRAALLAYGEAAMLSDLTGLRAHRIPYLPDETLVRVLVPDSVHKSSRQFVVARRTTRPPRAVVIDGAAVAPVYRALSDFVLRDGDERESLAVAAAAVQLGRVSVQQLVDEAEAGPARGRPRLLRTIAALQSGIRSAPEDDFRRIVRSSRILPEPSWNPRLVLPSGAVVSPDALFADAGVVHETNGRDVHAGFRDFDDMQRRHDELTAAGLTVLHNSPRRLRESAADVLAEVERCYRRLAGRGLPAGVRLLTPSNAPLRGLSA
jgi:hypothetical protein